MNQVICELVPSRNLPVWQPGVTWPNNVSEEVYLQRQQTEAVFRGIVNELFTDIAPILEAEIFPSDKASRKERKQKVDQMFEHVIANKSTFAKLGYRAMKGALELGDAVVPSRKHKGLEQRMISVWYSPVVILTRTVVKSAVEATKQSSTGQLALTAQELADYTIANKDEDYLTRVAGFNRMDVDFALSTAAKGLADLRRLREPVFMQFYGNAVTLRTEEHNRS